MEYVIFIDAYDMEKQQIRISFILPFYGVERYIGKCLESIYTQDVPEDQYEVICVNDCSPDHSEDVVLEYAQKHANLALIRHEVNKKLGAARNTGLRASKGRYVWFIDTDDYIQDNCLAHVLGLCEKNDLEILHFNIQDNFGNIMRRLVPTGVITGPEEELISENQQCIEITFPWNRVYKKEFLIENGLWFNDLYGGDVIHTILAVNVCRRIMNVDEFFHFYRIDNYSSDTKSAATAQKIYDMSYILAQAIDEIVPQIKPQWRPEIAECVPWRINTSIRGVMRLPKDEQMKLMSMLKNNPSLYEFILQHGDYQTRLIIGNIYMLRLASFVYVNLRNIKRRISSNSINT